MLGVALDIRVGYSGAGRPAPYTGTTLTYAAGILSGYSRAVTRISADAAWEPPAATYGAGVIVGTAYGATRVQLEAP